MVSQETSIDPALTVVPVDEDTIVDFTLEVWIYIYIYIYVYIYIYICREVCGPHIAVELGCVTHCKNKAFYSLTSATKAGPSP